MIELMVVILIVGILAAVAIPLMRGRIDSAKWTEGKAAMGTIATALRAYTAEVGGDLSALTFPMTDFTVLGVTDDDLEGTIFSAASGDYQIFTATYSTAQTPNLQFEIRATCFSETLVPAQVTLTHGGVWGN